MDSPTASDISVGIEQATALLDAMSLKEGAEKLKGRKKPLRGLPPEIRDMIWYALLRLGIVEDKDYFFALSQAHPQLGREAAHIALSRFPLCSDFGIFSGGERDELKLRFFDGYQNAFLLDFVCPGEVTIRIHRDAIEELGDVVLGKVTEQLIQVNWTHRHVADESRRAVPSWSMQQAEELLQAIRKKGNAKIACHYIT
ncbi:hypothetical protein PGQ11_009299 [Apiospora arundinis]|uniref:Uncharacterized protein n=1 Tax=Apiospora arundinis TaxID=335852 RepID=A0ABR2IIC2_9PEZI